MHIDAYNMHKPGVLSWRTHETRKAAEQARSFVRLFAHGRSPLSLHAGFRALTWLVLSAVQSASVALCGKGGVRVASQPPSPPSFNHQEGVKKRGIIE